MRHVNTWAIALGAGLLWASSAGAVTPADKCEAAKNKIAGKYYFCRAKAEAKALTASTSPDYSKCTAKFDDKWNTAETIGDGMCPDNMSTASMNAYVATQAAEAAAVIAGGPLAGCGDSIVNASGETCDGSDLAGETCVSLGFTSGSLSCSGCAFDLSGCAGCSPVSGLPATGQTTPHGAGSDGFVQAGTAMSFTDNGDGTITDNVTGLMWEKKSNDGSDRDKDYVYQWGFATTPPYLMDGFGLFLGSLNGGSGFAGYTDWRIPNVKELQSIVNYEIPTGAPLVPSVFNNNCVPGCTVFSCSCTPTDFYWSSSSVERVEGASNAWGVDFFIGTVDRDLKTQNNHVRAVRGGL